MTPKEKYWQDEVTWCWINMGKDKVKWLKDSSPEEFKKASPRMFWLSIKHKDDCLFSRRNGYVGKIIFKYSVRLRLFGRDIL